MILWMVLTLLVAVAVAALTVPLARRYDTRRGGEGALAVLRAQLAELDALPPAEAEPLRLEIKRRMLAEGVGDTAPARPLTQRALTWFALGVAAAVAIVATGLYYRLGRPELASPATAAPPPPQQAEAVPDDVARMVAQLEAKMKAQPNDPEGWRMLGWSYFQTRRFAESANAYGRAAALAPADATYVSAQGEALVQAADGSVTPAAKAAFDKAHALDPADARSRYFIALWKEERGDARGAVDDWLALLKDAPADADYVPQLRAIVSEAARKANIDIADRLPAAPATPPLASAPGAPAGVMPGPNAAEVQAAQQMAPADQQAMIRGMVDRLAARLAANPKDADGWIRLMRARLVLGDRAAATAAYRSAKAAFAGDAATSTQLDNAAKEMAISG